MLWKSSLLSTQARDCTHFRATIIIIMIMFSKNVSWTICQIKGKSFSLASEFLLAYHWLILTWCFFMSSDVCSSRFVKVHCVSKSELLFWQQRRDGTTLWQQLKSWDVSWSSRVAFQINVVYYSVVFSSCFN